MVCTVRKFVPENVKLETYLLCTVRVCAVTLLQHPGSDSQRFLSTPTYRKGQCWLPGAKCVSNTMRSMYANAFIDFYCVSHKTYLPTRSHVSGWQRLTKRIHQLLCISIALVYACKYFLSNINDGMLNKSLSLITGIKPSAFFHIRHVWLKSQKQQTAYNNNNNNQRHFFLLACSCQFHSPSFLDIFAWAM